MDLKNLSETPPWEWPKSVGPGLLRVLRDAQASGGDRVLAAELAGDLVVANDEIVQALLTILRDGDASPELRAQAAVSLGPVLEYTDAEGFDDELSEPPISEATFQEILDTLRALFAAAATPKIVRRRILEAAVRAPQDWHKSAITEAHDRDDEEWKLTAVYCMGHQRGFAKEILEALESRNEEMREEAIRAAGEQGLQKAWSHVAPLLSVRTAKPLLLAAIAAAPTIRPKEAQALLIDLTESEDEEIAAAVEEALGLAEVPWDEDDEEDEETR